jgi:predicted RNA binding protein YcfA (HicA-like mRNA interferase family)
MARLANIPGKQTVKAFNKAGWSIVGQVESHVVMSKEGNGANLSLSESRGGSQTSPS